MITVTLALVKALRDYRALQEAGTIARHDPWVFTVVRAAPSDGEDSEVQAENEAQAEPGKKKAKTGPPVLNDRNFHQRYWMPAVASVPGADFTPHALRHLWASRVLASGAPVAFVADQLGHSSPAFTYRQYVRFLPESAGAASAYVEQALGGEKAPRNPKVIPRLKVKNSLTT